MQPVLPLTHAFTLLHVILSWSAEPPFAIAQGVVLLLFVSVAVLAVRRIRPGLQPAVALAPLRNPS